MLKLKLSATMTRKVVQNLIKNKPNSMKLCTLEHFREKKKELKKPMKKEKLTKSQRKRPRKQLNLLMNLKLKEKQKM